MKRLKKGLALFLTLALVYRTGGTGRDPGRRRTALTTGCCCTMISAV